MSDLTLRAWFKATVSDLADGAFALLRMTKQRGLHVNLRDDAGAELGTVANPINVSGSAGSPNINVAQIGGTAQSGANVVDVPNTALRVNVVAGAAGGGAVTQATSPWVVGQATGSNLHVVVDTAPTTAVTNAGLTNLDVALSTRTKPADQQHAIIDSGTTVVTQPTGTNLHVVVDSAPAVAGTVAVSNFPATQPVSGTIAATQGTSPWRIAGDVNAIIAPPTGYASLTLQDSNGINWRVTELDTGVLQTAVGGTIPQTIILNDSLTAGQSWQLGVTTGGILTTTSVTLSPASPLSLGLFSVSSLYSRLYINAGAIVTSTPTSTAQSVTVSNFPSFPATQVVSGTVTPSNASVEHSDAWYQTALLGQILVELRALRMSFSTVSGQYLENSDLDITSLQ